MTTEDMIVHIFCYVDDRMQDVQKRKNASLCPSELVTISILFALRGGRFRAFYRWLKRDYDRTHLQRLLAHHQGLCDRFLESPTFSHS